MINTLKTLSTLAIITTSLLFTGCTANQQDSILDSTVSMARESNGLIVKTAPAKDVTLTYMERTSSVENAETLVLVHGFSASKDNWLRFAKALDEKYHVIIIDLAGHGDSDQELTIDYNLVAQAERLDAFFSGLNINSFHIVGNSMGGAISLLYTLNRPEKIKSLMLMNSAGIDGDNKSEYYKALETGTNPLIATDENSFEFRMDLTMSQPPLLPWPLKPAVIRKTLAREDINKKIFKDMVATKQLLADVNFDHKIKNFMQENPIPTMIMWGEEDRVLDVSAAAAFKELIPQASVHIFPEIGHLPMIENPEESAGVYQKFITTL